MFIFSLSLLLMIVLSGCTECRNGFQSTIVTVPRDSWFPIVQDILSNTSVRLNNYTPNRNEFDGRQEFAFFRRGDSRITIGGENFDISQLDDESMIRRPPFTVYLNDINSESSEVTTVSSDLILTINLEGDGTEIITDCINNIICVEKPSANVDDATIQFRFRPVVDENGSVSFSVRADFSANTRISMCNDSFWAFLCDIIGINGGVLNNAIEEQLNEAVNSSNISSQFSQRIMPLITSVLAESERLLAIAILPNGDLLVVKAVPCS